MKHYNPDHTPDPKEWLALGEAQRIQLAENYHRIARIKLPNLKMHAIFHAIIENQIAENVESVARAIERLISEGLSRHDAVHAVASVLANHIHDLFNAKADQNNSMAIYNAAVERLTAKSWHDG